MSDIPSFGETVDKAKETVDGVRKRLSTVPKGPDCPHCSEEMEPDVVYDRTMYEYTEAWTCDDCDYAEYRDEEPL